MNYERLIVAAPGVSVGGCGGEPNIGRDGANPSVRSTVSAGADKPFDAGAGGLLRFVAAVFHQ